MVGEGGQNMEIYSPEKTTIKTIKYRCRYLASVFNVSNRVIRLKKKKRILSLKTRVFIGIILFCENEQKTIT